MYARIGRRTRSEESVLAALYQARLDQDLSLKQLSLIMYRNDRGVQRLSLYERGKKAPTLGSLLLWVEALGMKLVVVPAEGRPDDPPPSIICPRCQATSYHPEDVRHGYCGRCHEFTGTDRGVA